MRGEVEEPGQIKGHENDPVKQGALLYGQIPAAGHLQAYDSVAKQEQDKADAQQLVVSESGEGCDDVHDQIRVVAKRYQRQGVGLIS